MRRSSSIRAIASMACNKINLKSHGWWRLWCWYNDATDRFNCGDRLLIEDVSVKCRELSDEQIVELIETEIAVDLMINS